MAADSRHLAKQLQELIAALDRRVPQIGRADEPSIARDAAALKAKAIRRLSELHRQHPVRGAAPSRAGGRVAGPRSRVTPAAAPAPLPKRVASDGGDLGSRPLYPADAAIYWRIRRR
jgi:hypothetical protein